jgi:hypothetical protein
VESIPKPQLALLSDAARRVALGTDEGRFQPDIKRFESGEPWLLITDANVASIAEKDKKLNKEQLVSIIHDCVELLALRDSRPEHRMQLTTHRDIALREIEADYMKLRPSLEFLRDAFTRGTCTRAGCGRMTQIRR